MACDQANGTPENDAAVAMRRCFDRLEGVWRLDRRILDRPGDAGQGTGAEVGRGVGTRFEAGDATARKAGRLTADGAAVAPAMGARLRGEARFQRLDDDALAYSEEGTLVLANGARVRAVRHYVYRLDGIALLVEFADGPDAGRRYLRFDAAADGAGRIARSGRDAGAAGSDWRAADQHQCGRDLYEAAYRFRGFDGGDAARRIVQRTTVTGPRKGYAIVTLLRPRSSV